MSRRDFRKKLQRIEWEKDQMSNDERGSCRAEEVGCLNKVGWKAMIIVYPLLRWLTWMAPSRPATFRVCEYREVRTAMNGPAQATQLRGRLEEEKCIGPFAEKGPVSSQAAAVQSFVK